MTALFADTFFWIALTDATDSAHQRALTLAAEWVSDIFTTDEVLVEYLTFFATAHEDLRSRALAHARRILDEPGIHVIQQSRDSLLSGMALYGARPDKKYSLVDCISMQTMRREGLTNVLTSDHHFEQEGFRALFKDS